MSQFPRVTVVVRTRNRPEMLSDALRSVGRQGVRDIELIVVNDGGQDVEALVQRHARQAGLQYHYLVPARHLGRAGAANAGLDAASGEYLCLLDDDDWFLPDHLGALVPVLDARPEVPAAYSNVEVVRRNGDHWDTVDIFAHPFDSLRLAYENFMPIHSVLFRRHLIDGGHCRFPDLDAYEDWAFWLQAARLGPFVHVDRTTACYRVGHGGGFGHAAELPEAAEIRSQLLPFVRWARHQWSDEHLVELVARASAHAASARDFGAALCAHGEGRGSDAVGGLAVHHANTFGSGIVGHAGRKAATALRGLRRLIAGLADRR
nr:glycosyltransferase [Thioalkalivibrio paradoxus]